MLDCTREARTTCDIGAVTELPGPPRAPRQNRRRPGPPRARGASPSVARPDRACQGQCPASARRTPGAAGRTSRLEPAPGGKAAAAAGPGALGRTHPLVLCCSVREGGREGTATAPLRPSVLPLCSLWCAPLAAVRLLAPPAALVAMRPSSSFHAAGASLSYLDCVRCRRPGPGAGSEPAPSELSELRTVQEARAR